MIYAESQINISCIKYSQNYFCCLLDETLNIFEGELLLSGKIQNIHYNSEDEDDSSDEESEEVTDSSESEESSESESEPTDSGSDSSQDPSSQNIYVFTLKQKYKLTTDDNNSDKIKIVLFWRIAPIYGNIIREPS